ncbi:MAG: NADH-quinone oxidoreductase subunit N, partial [Gemmatimonadetes bacterium]|nr:NADH-quinone oxidoreductase subunit N [Gemmatimonadota bacterium]
MNGVAFEPGFSRQLGDLAPYLIVAGGGLAAMLADAFRRGDRSGGLFGLSLVTLLGAAFAYLRPSGSGSDTLLGGMLANDPYTGFFGLLFLGIALLTLVFGAGPFGRAGVRGDFYPVLLFATLGMMVLAAANDFLSLYLGLETMSLATYVLVGGRKGSAHSSEAGFKYLLLGGFASAFLLFGIALTFGFAGSTSLDAVRAALAVPNHEAWLLAAGGGLILIGFGFKIAMVPFHMWTPDVYDGAPSHVTGFMATGIKAAAFAALLRVTLVLLPAFSSFWFPLLAVLAVVTMTLGNLVALAQTNLKRLLAYSSIAHAGYLLLGVLALLVPHTRQGHAAAEAAGGGVLFYLVGYAVMNLAAFGIVSFLGNPAPDRDADADDLRGYAGLARRQPLAAAALAI